MKIRQKFRMYPNKEQERILNQWIGCARFVWNKFLEKNNERYENEKSSFSITKWPLSWHNSRMMKNMLG